MRRPAIMPAHVRQASGAPVIDGNAASVLRNTYLLLGISLVPSVIGAAVSSTMPELAGSLGWGTFALFFIFMIGMQFAISAFANSIIGVLLLQVFTFGMGFWVGISLGVIMATFSNGALLVAYAAGGTALTFFVLAAYATTTARDFTGVSLSKGLFIGMICAFILGLVGMLLQSPLISLLVSLIFIPIACGYIVVTLNRIVRGGERNYIMATMTLFIMLLNLFMSILYILVAFAGNRE